MVGDSAGRQMAMQYLTTLINPEFQALFGYTTPGLTVRAAAINCSASFLMRPDALVGPQAAYFTPDVTHRDDLRLHTEDYMNTALPPLFLMTSNQDFIRDHTVRLDGYLLAKGIAHEFHSYGSETDPRGHVFHCNIKDPLAIQCNLAEIAFFRRYQI